MGQKNHKSSRVADLRCPSLDYTNLFGTEKNHKSSRMTDLRCPSLDYKNFFEKFLKKP